ncbi:efflux RND transporter permease subunit [Pendulispora rubella]|uniref:Efflux RND transporter permease subunit n=1 Tax=Pendulispora rubella TaxID=2741070 RepID=A0ABZ2L5J1_9BACT
MWLVRAALKHSYTFVVMAVFIVLVGGIAIVRMPVDIFPDVNIPVISVIWRYGGLSPEEMETRIVRNYESLLTTLVNDIEHVESQSLQGVAVIKVYFQPGASVEAATAQITAMSQSALSGLPPGITPPLVLRYSASNVPILQAALDGEGMTEQQLLDYGLKFVCADIETVPGVQIPWPYGGKQRQIMIDIDPARLYAWGLSPRDVNAALSQQNVILPTGTAKMGDGEYPISVNGSPRGLDDMGDLPLKAVQGTTIRLRDVASVRDGSAPQTSVVHVEGKRSVLITFLKTGAASTLDVVAGIRKILPATLARVPKELKVALLFDQSVFVRSAVTGVVREALISAGLTAAMLLFFLGSWRSTIIAVISIPLSILVSIIVLYALGQTLNIMTLGGMSLAVGILVDDATVEIENVHRNLAMGKPLVEAILDGAFEVAVPAFVSTLCICIVFVPVGFITGPAKSLFVPLALAVVFALLTSYFLSRTLVPTLMNVFLRRERRHFPRTEVRGFDRLRARYGRWLEWVLEHRGIAVGGFTVFVALSCGLFPLVGRDFFPNVDAGLIKLHVRGAPGTRLEETEIQFARIERTIRSVIPKDDIRTLLDNIGVPNSGINLSLSEGALISPADGQIFIALEEGHAPTADYVRKLRKTLNETYPDSTFFFLAPDISSQVLNFGLAAPIDVQIAGGNDDATVALAKKMATEIANIPGTADVHLAQVARAPRLHVDVDRTMANQAGMSARDVASDLLVSLSSSSQVSPNWWRDERGYQYAVAVQTPQYQVDSIAALQRTPLSTPQGAMQLLSNVASVSRTTGPQNVTHVDATRTYDVQVNVEGRDLGSVAAAVGRVVEGMKPDYPRGTTVVVKGQAESMESSFRGLTYGLVFAVILVYLLLVINFQSWMDPLVILMALPGAVAGIAWMLFLSHTTLSVPALMGAMMCIGVATANSTLLVTFANDLRKEGLDAMTAASTAAMTRLRPVLMTALAMVLGMLPAALGLEEGGEQNAPLGRAVIGGLVLATLATLFFVPVMYTLLPRRQSESEAS